MKGKGEYVSQYDVPVRLANLPGLVGDARQILYNISAAKSLERLVNERSCTLVPCSGLEELVAVVVVVGTSQYRGV